MTDMQAAPIQGTAPLSTTIDVGHSSTAVGGGAPPAEKQAPPPPAKPETPADTMRAELARQREEEAKDAEKLKGEGDEAAKAAKAKLDDVEKAKDTDKTKSDPKRKDEEFADKAKPSYSHETDGPGGKQSDAEKLAAGQETADKSRQSEGRQHQEPPARFLPEARTKWANVPNEVKAEFHRVSEEYEGELSKAKQTSERYEPIRQFDEIAKQNGRELKDSLAKVVEIEQSIARNPVAGLDAVLREIGPRKADGSAVSLYEVAQSIARMTPQQYAQMVGGQQGQSQPRQQQADPEVAALKSELSEIKSSLAHQRAAPIIETFAASHTDYHALEEQIAAVLKSGVIDQIYGTGLSPAQKLEQAYRMAGGQSPSRSAPEPALVHSAAAADRPVDPDGAKSIRGAPTGGSDPDDDGDDVTDIGKLLRREARKLA